MIIEIAGPPHIGKAHIATALAKRFEIEELRFPVINLKSFTSAAISKGLRTKDIFGSQPYWWPLMWAAHYNEYSGWLSSPSPKIIVNYTTNYKAWNKATNPNCSEYVKHLPQPKKIYYVEAKQLLYSPDQPCFFEKRHVDNFLSYYSKLRDKKLMKVATTSARNSMTSTKLNDITDQIADDIELCFKLKSKHISGVPEGVA